MPLQDVTALTAGLLEMIDDQGLRSRCASSAVETARGFTMAAVGGRWDELLEELWRAERRAPVAAAV